MKVNYHNSHSFVGTTLFFPTNIFFGVLLRRAARDIDQTVWTSDLVVDNVPAVEFAPCPVISPVASSLQVGWEVSAILAGSDTAIIVTPRIRPC